MAKESYTKHKGSDGKTYETRKSTYSDGSSKSVTREQGGMFSEGRLVKVTRISK